MLCSLWYPDIPVRGKYKEHLFPPLNLKKKKTLTQNTSVESELYLDHVQATWGGEGKSELLWSVVVIPRTNIMLPEF